MKKDIVVIRESITKIVSLLTLRAIKVTQRGASAYVKYHPKTGAIIELNVPYIPDDASEEFIAAVQGFLDHEVGHVLYSDAESLKRGVKLGKRVANLANIIEDVFVERRMTEAFRGSSVNLESTRKFFLEKISRPKIEAAIKAGNLDEARGIAMVPAFRAWGGQAACADFIADPKIAELLKPVVEKMGPELIDAIGRCNSSDECLDLAVKVKSKLETPKPPPPPPESELDKALSDMGKEGKFSDALDSEEEPEDDKAEPEDKGKTSVEADDSGKTGSDESDKVEGEAEGEAPAADSSGDDEGGSGEGGDEPADEPAETEPTPKADGPDESDAGMGTESKDDKEGEGSGDEPGDSSPGADDAAPSSEGDAEGEGEPTEPADDPLADMLDSEADFDKELSKKLGETAKKETDESAYAIFSKDWDVISPARLSTSPTSAAKLEHSIKDKIGVMQKHLERGIAAQARKCWNPGQRTGRIAPGALFKTSVGDDRVFRKRFETRAKNTAVSLVIDCSGSMSGSRIELAGVTAFALASVLERIKLDYEVIGFTSGHSGEMIELMRQDADTHGESFRSMGWARMEPLYMPVFKDFKGRLDTNAKSRIAHLTEDPSWLLQNVDGECVQIAARRLKQIHAERHVMIVLSDGEPCCAAGKGLGAHLKKTVKEVTKSGVEVIGIGIQTASVKAFYPKHLVLNDLETLPTQAMAELTKLLLA